MIKIFTPNDIIRYLYKETSEEESACIESALVCDNELLDKYQDFSSIKRQLEKVMKCSHEKTINRVMAYSKSLDLHA